MKKYDRYRLTFAHDIISEEDDCTNVIRVDRPITTDCYLSPFESQELNKPEILTLLSNKIYTFWMKWRKQMKLIIESDKIIIDGTEYVQVKKEIQVGDRVKVVYPGKRYSTYPNWPGWEKVPLEYAVRYAYGGGAWDNVMKNETFRVIHITYNDSLTNVTLALIESEKYGECYLFNVDGLEMVGKGNETV